MVMQHGKAGRVTSWLLVGVQFACMGAILVSGPWVAGHGAFFVLELSGCLLGMWAVAAMQWRNLHVLPEVRPGSRLVTDGPYRWIRHPMYTALLMVTLALVGASLSYWRGGCWVTLCATLVVKLSREETCLREAFDDYDAYRLRTWRLIPWMV